MKRYLSFLVLLLFAPLAMAVDYHKYNASKIVFSDNTEQTTAVPLAADNSLGPTKLLQSGTPDNTTYPRWDNSTGTPRFVWTAPTGSGTTSLPWDNITGTDCAVRQAHIWFPLLDGGYAYFQGDNTWDSLRLVVRDSSANMGARFQMYNDNSIVLEADAGGADEMYIGMSPPNKTFDIGASAGSTIRIGGNADNVNITRPLVLLDNTIEPADLQKNSGTASSSTYYRGDGAWATPSGTAIALPKAYNLKATTTGGTDNQCVKITADSALMLDDSDSPALVKQWSVEVDLSNSGANGLDTGSVAANTGYYLYLIYNGATKAGLASTSSTAPTLPTGYTYSVLVSWATTDNTSTPFNVEEFTQIDDIYTWKVPQKVGNDVGSGTTSIVDLSVNGVLGYAVVPPSLAKKACGKVVLGNLFWFYGPETFDNSLSGGNDISPYELSTEGSGQYTESFCVPMPTTGQEFYHQVSGGGAIDIWISGFELKPIGPPAGV